MASPQQNDNDKIAKAVQQQQQQQHQLPPIASNPQAHLEYLIEKSSTAKTWGRGEATGGILPIVRDPDTKLAYFLLGLNHQNKYCHFHGWVDPGETADIGAAREAFEESKGVLGRLVDLWRAVVCKGVFSALIGRGGMHLVNLGDMNSIERDAFVEKFANAKAWSACSDEVAAVHWFDALAFRHAALLQQQDPTATKGDVVVEVDVKRGIRRKLRGWLGEIFSDQEFWSQKILQDSLDHGFIPLIPITHLPRISDEVLERLPYCLEKMMPQQMQQQQQQQKKAVNKKEKEETFTLED
jgi:hypothetical protein